MGILDRRNLGGAKIVKSQKMLNFPLVGEGLPEVSWSMAKERMKWNLTFGLIGDRPKTN